jgi:hypothetical protein
LGCRRRRAQPNSPSNYYKHTYGHCNFPKLRKLLSLKPGDNPECPSCTEVKSRQAGLSKTTTKRATRVLGRLHVDLGFGRNSKPIFQLVIDDKTRKSYIDILSSKAETLVSLKPLIKKLENKHAPWKVAIIRTDEESIFAIHEWDEFCQTAGIEHETSGRYKHGQNGVVERAMQTIGNPARAMMIHANAPEEDFADALRHANVCRNNFLTKANNGRTPQRQKLESSSQLASTSFGLRGAA